MGVSPYYYDPDNFYWSPTKVDNKEGLPRNYAMPWDAAFSGGFFAVFYVLWSLVWSVCLNFLLFQYVLQWQIVVNFAMVLVELGILVIGFVAASIMAWSTDDATKKIKIMRAENVEIENATVIGVRRSRMAWNGDLVLMLVGLTCVIWELTYVCSYIWGTSGDKWASANHAHPLYIVNYPLTSAHWGSTFDARLVENVNYRSYLHNNIVIKGFIIIAAFILTRFSAMDTLDRRLLHESLGNNVNPGAAADFETRSRVANDRNIPLAAQQQAQSAPLMTAKVYAQGVGVGV